jgi:hypothetical protein
VLAAPEAVPRLTVGRDDERRGLLGVEGAESLVDSARALQRDGLADDVDDRELRLDFGNDAG